jgi:hypothetical protein
LMAALTAAAATAVAAALPKIHVWGFSVSGNWISIRDEKNRGKKRTNYYIFFYLHFLNWWERKTAVTNSHSLVEKPNNWKEMVL